MSREPVAQARGETILRCRHLWKIYGASPAAALGGAIERDLPAAECRDLVARVRASGHIVACCNVSFDVRVGEIFVIMGLSGSGKSTVVRCLSRLVEPTNGAIELAGENLLRLTEKQLIEMRRHKMGMVFQNFGLLPHQTVLDNVAFPLKVQGVARAPREARAREMIELVGLEGREHAFPRELSGGQQQRVGIARSLAVEPQIWFLDEPFSALDPLIRRQMQDEFLRLQRMLHKSIVFITHDFLEALRVADRIAIMKDGEIVQIGTPAEVVMKPATDYVAEFTKDVPLTRVLSAGDVAERSADAPACAARVPATMPLDALFAHLAKTEGPLAVTDAEGAVIGQVSHRHVMRALAEGSDERARETVAP